MSMSVVGKEHTQKHNAYAKKSENTLQASNKEDRWYSICCVAQVGLEAI